jgi:hypothetical protein
MESQRVGQKLKTTTEHFYPNRNQLESSKSPLQYSESFARAKSVTMHSE